jgi:hypothetical protein
MYGRNWLRVVRNRNWLCKKNGKTKGIGGKTLRWPGMAQERNWKLRVAVEIQGIDRKKTCFNQRLER